jgi:hypothetical protein
LIRAGLELREFSAEGISFCHLIPQQ